MRWPPAVLFVMLTATSAVTARADRPSGADAFVTEVLRRNPTLQARVLARDAVRRQAGAAGLWPDPSAAVMLDRVPERMDGEMPMVRYQISQMLPWPGKLGLMRESLERRADGAQADSRTQTLELVREAKRAYWMLLLNKGLRSVNAAGRGLLTTIVSAALARYGTGTGQHHEVVRAEVERNVLDVEAIDLEGERVASVAMMNALRNQPADALIPDPPEPLEPLDSRATAPRSLSRLLAFAASRRPELERMRAMRREEVTMAKLARRERYPDLMTSVWYNQMIGGQDTVGMMVGATIPLFNVSRQNRLAEAAELRAASAASSQAGMIAMIRFEVSDALRKVVTATRTLELVTGVAIPRAQQSFVSSLSGYSAGTADIVGVLEAWRALQSAETARVQAVAVRLMALADLERAIGGSLEEVRK
jgi:outer membrane protein, heavy metal efflux system